MRLSLWTPPRISVCPCQNDWGFVDVSLSPLPDLLPDRCTPELRRLQAELSARHSYREAAGLLTILLPCNPVSHATMGNRPHRVAADLERNGIARPNREPEVDPADEMLVLIDGAHIWAAHGYQSRHLDITVGKIEVSGRQPRRFALAPRGADSPLATRRQALRDLEWQPGRPVTILSDGEAALPGLVRASVGDPITCIRDCRHISMCVQHVGQAVRGIYALEPRHRAGLEMVEERICSLRHLIWNNYHQQAHDELFGMRHMASEVAYLNDEEFRSHWIAVVRAAVLDGRLKPEANARLAA